jgi:hypothetical protein
MEEIENKSDNSKSKGMPTLKSMDDLPNFLKSTNANEEEAIKILTRFLIQDDFTLKKYGVVYDQTGFDGLGKEEVIASIGTEERLNQRAKSSANIWFKEKYPKLTYDSYGVEPQMDEIVPNWRIFKVLMIGGKGETTYLKVCLPLDESLTALVGDKDEPCAERASFVDKEKEKNEDYISKIKTNNFFKKKKNYSGMVKLLPGEKMIVRDEKNKDIVLDANSLRQQSMRNGFLDPPSVDSSLSDPYLLALNKKKNKKAKFNKPMTINSNKRNENNNQNNNFNIHTGLKSNNFNGTMSPEQFMGNGNNNNFRFNQVNNKNINGQQMNSYYNNNNNNNFMNYRFNSMNKKDDQPSLNPAQKIAQGLNNNNVKTPSIPDQMNNTPIPNTTNNNDPNNPLMMQLNALKEQMNMLTAQIKQKDQIIKEQSEKIGENGNNMGMNNLNGFGFPQDPKKGNLRKGLDPNQQNLPQESQADPNNINGMNNFGMNNNMNGGNWMPNNNFNNQYMGMNNNNNMGMNNNFSPNSTMGTNQGQGMYPNMMQGQMGGMNFPMNGRMGNMMPNRGGPLRKGLQKMSSQIL